MAQILHTSSSSTTHVIDDDIGVYSDTRGVATINHVSANKIYCKRVNPCLNLLERPY